MTFTRFAYGSNLCLTRLRGRVPGACLVGLASLDAYEVRWHKKSKDGSAKLNIVESTTPNAVVLGAVFSIPTAEKRLLDRAEGLNVGYEEKQVTVRTREGAVRAQTYVATDIDDTLRPYSWYRDLVVSGARGLGLVASYVESLNSVPVREDPNAGREQRERAYLPCDAPGKTRFLREDFHRLALVGALQRSGTYGEGTSEAARRAFRLDLRNSLDELAAQYDRTVSDEQHTAAIAELARALSERHLEILRDGRFRIGVAQKALNLFLKYLWCAGWICQPPHCPFDRAIINLLPSEHRIAWTKCDDIDEYRTLVDAAREAAGGKALAVWELEMYSRLAAGSV